MGHAFLYQIWLPTCKEALPTQCMGECVWVHACVTAYRVVDDERLWQGHFTGVDALLQVVVHGRLPCAVWPDRAAASSVQDSGPVHLANLKLVLQLKNDGICIHTTTSQMSRPGLIHQGQRD